MPQKKKLKTKDENKVEEKLDELDEESNSMSDDSHNFEDNSDEDDSDEDIDKDEEIMIDFEARSLRETDLDSAKVLIKQKLGPFNSLNIIELTEAVVKQESIGNAIYQIIANENEDEDGRENEAKNDEEEDEDLDDTIFGILSILDLASPKIKSFASGLKTFLLKSCEAYGKQQGSPKLADKLSSVFQTKKVAYIINERYVNIPPAISVPMFDSLLKDIESLKDEINSCKDADYWLLLAKYFVESPQNSKAAKSSKKEEESSAGVNIYSNPEEEILEEFSEFKFDISYAGRIANSTNGKWSDGDVSLQPYLKVFLLPKENISDALAKVKLLVK